VSTMQFRYISLINVSINFDIVLFSHCC